jgi:predicted nucleotidyltransferase component of viral defense system
MITQSSITKEWIETVAKSNKADKNLVEKVIRALLLLEGLSESGLNYVFKGGTALMLLLNSEKRLSIDIDIIVSNKETDLNEILGNICTTKGFINFEKQERVAETNIDKEHYKLFFVSALNNQESHILLDVLREEIHYQNIIELPIDSTFINHINEPITVRLPDFNNILGDKLTAFAPNTTGIPYLKGKKEMGMEIIKQMYDIGCLCDKADNPEIVSAVFSSFAETELVYRENKGSIENVLDDIIETALSVCLRQSQGKSDFNILHRGIIQVKPFIFSEQFHLEKAITYAAKAAYIASVIKFGVKLFSRFSKELYMKTWIITEPTNTKLNKIKKTDPEAFYYLYQMSEIMKNKGGKS